jgi:hypothetical protein
MNTYVPIERILKFAYRAGAYMRLYLQLSDKRSKTSVIINNARRINI